MDRRDFIASAFGAALTAPNIDAAAGGYTVPEELLVPKVGEYISLTHEQVALHCQIFDDFKAWIDPRDLTLDETMQNGDELWVKVSLKPSARVNLRFIYYHGDERYTIHAVSEPTWAVDKDAYRFFKVISVSKTRRTIETRKA